LRSRYRDGRFQLLHCHYAGRYGAWGVLSRIHPLVISIWGSDILLKPEKSRFHKALIGRMLKSADFLQSTSRNMAVKVDDLYGIKDVSVIPFGIDADRFSPAARLQRERFRIVAVKSLRHVYGLDLLIKAVSAIQKEDNILLECLIYGEGEARGELERLVIDLALSNTVTFMGRANHDEIPRILADADLAVYPSRSESFGVSALEAMACGCPVIMSDASGHVEISEGLPSAKLFQRESLSSLVAEMRKVMANADEVQTSVQDALQRVRTKYDWNDCLKQQRLRYAEILAKHQ
jgi:L-malate glycosyltransferase